MEIGDCVVCTGRRLPESACCQSLSSFAADSAVFASASFIKDARSFQSFRVSTMLYTIAQSVPREEGRPGKSFTGSCHTRRLAPHGSMWAVAWATCFKKRERLASLDLDSNPTPKALSRLVSSLDRMRCYNNSWMTMQRRTAAPPSSRHSTSSNTWHRRNCFRSQGSYIATSRAGACGSSRRRPTTVSILAGARSSSARAVNDEGCHRAPVADNLRVPTPCLFRRSYPKTVLDGPPFRGSCQQASRRGAAQYLLLQDPYP